MVCLCCSLGLCFPHQGGGITILTQCHRAANLVLWAGISAAPVGEVGCLVGKGRRSHLLMLVVEGGVRGHPRPLGWADAFWSQLCCHPCSGRACSAFTGLCSTGRQTSARRASGQKSLVCVFCSFGTRQIFQYLLKNICIFMDKFKKKGTTQSQFASLISIETTGALIAFMCF